MKITTIALILTTALPQSVCATEFVIRETESAIIVEYVGEPDGKPADAKATQTAPLPVPSTPNAPLASTKDEEEKPSERSKARAEASAVSAKARATKIARNNKPRSDTSSFGDNPYLQSVNTPEE